MIKPLHRLLAETASILKDCDKAADRAGKPSDGKQWRQLALCRREYDALLAKSELVDAIMEHRVTDPAEVERLYTKILEAEAAPIATAKEGA